MGTLLWLDDYRNPYKGGWLYEFAREYETNGGVIWLKSYNEFVSWINENGLPDKIAFDHDLGDNSKSGFECCKWLVDYCIDNNKSTPDWVVQSSNPVGKDNINGLLSNFKSKYKF